MFGIIKKNRKNRPANKFAPNIESLENRQLMTATMDDGTLTIDSTSGDDSIMVRDYGWGLTEVVENGTRNYFAGVRAVLIEAGDGDDRINNYGSAPTVIDAGDGDDQIYNRSALSDIYGGDGNDYVSNDSYLGGYIYGQDGDDWIYGSYGADTIVGGEGDDFIAGSDGDDTIYGMSGDDTLNAGAGHDKVFAGWGNDRLLGGSGNDSLYGGGGVDELFGQGGNDGLFGGGKWSNDTLNGGRGNDRFLVQTDTVSDLTSEDARITFEDKAAATHNYAGFGRVSFSAGAWTDQEIQRVDVALANLHSHGAGTSLLKLANHSEMTFARQGDQLTDLGGTVILGGNGGSTITLNTPSFDTETGLLATVYHEIGHNWDDASENSLIDVFRGESGWTNVRPTKEVTDLSSWSWATFSFGTKWELDGDYAASADDNGWYYNKSSDFAREYGKHNPFEDWATSFATYFLNEYHDDAGGRETVANKNLLVEYFVDHVNAFRV